MSPQSRRSGGILLVVLPTVIFGGVSILSLLISPQSSYMNNPLRQNLSFALKSLSQPLQSRMVPSWAVVKSSGKP
jgi:hypothetical protein